MRLFDELDMISEEELNDLFGNTLMILDDMREVVAKAQKLGISDIATQAIEIKMKAQILSDKVHFMLVRKGMVKNG